MSDEQKKIEIDLGRLKGVLNAYFSERMAGVWNETENILKHISICIGIIPCGMPWQPINPGKSKGYFWYTKKHEENVCKIEIGGFIDTGKDAEQQLGQIEKTIKTILGNAGWNEDSAFAHKWTKKICMNATAISDVISTVEYRAIFLVVYEDDKQVTSQVSSLMLTTIAVFLAENVDDVSLIVKPDEIKERLERKSTDDILNVYKKVLFERWKLPDLKDINKLSVTPYERRECIGTMVFMEKDEAQELIKKEKICVFQRRELLFGNTSNSNVDNERKLLEVCREENCIIVDRNSHVILGLANKRDVNENNVQIYFKGTANWYICIAGERVLQYQREEFFISQKIQSHELKKVLKKYGFSNQELADKVCKLDLIIEKLSKQAKHGALLVFLEENEAREQANRLCKLKRGRQVTRILLDNNNFVVGMAAMDGAIIVDFDGYCYAFGVILDGEATVEGKEDRGSRYNSAKIYIQGKRGFAIVISEDKERGIEILCSQDS